MNELAMAIAEPAKNIHDIVSPRSKYENNMAITGVEFTIVVIVLTVKNFAAYIKAK